MCLTYHHHQNHRCQLARRHRHRSHHHRRRHHHPSRSHYYQRHFALRRRSPDPLTQSLGRLVKYLLPLLIEKRKEVEKNDRTKMREKMKSTAYRHHHRRLLMHAWYVCIKGYQNIYVRTIHILRTINLFP